MAKVATWLPRAKNIAYNDNRGRLKPSYRSYLFDLGGEMLERNWQAGFIEDIRAALPGCYIIKTSANYIQGFPDLLVLYKNRWAALECKRSNNAAKQVNQEYYVGQLNDLSFSAFVSYQNQEEILHELQQAFRDS